MSPTEIAAARGLALSTIEGHLAEAIEAGQRLDLARLVPEEKRRAIEAAIANLGPLPLKTLREHLGEEYSYAEIRYVKAAVQDAAVEQAN